MYLLSIDPGPVQSAAVITTANGDAAPHAVGKLPNHELVYLLPGLEFDHCAIEMVASYGMPVGKSVFETCVWIGRLVAAVAPRCDPRKVYRKDVKMHLCGNMRAKDSNIRQALIDLYPATGGGALPAIGIKQQPGPLYGFSKDLWAALGVAHAARAHWSELEIF